MLSAAGAALLFGAEGRTPLTGGILLSTAALVCAAVAAAATAGVPPWRAELSDEGTEVSEEAATRDEASGEEREAAAGGAAAAPRGLVLSERLALGLLGGLLGGLAVSAAMPAVEGMGLAGLLGVEMPASTSASAIGLRAWYGAVWGLLFGLFYRWLPGTGGVGKGARFSVVPALYSLLVVYPFAADAGWLALDHGVLAFLFVLLYHLVWGAVAGALFGWAEEAQDGLLSRPLVE